MVQLDKLPKGYKICKKCSEVYRISSGIQKFCRKCTTFKCKNCGIEFRETGTLSRKLCSFPCYKQYTKGKPKKVNKDAQARSAKTIRALYNGPNRDELIAKISKTTSEAMYRPEVQEKIRQPRGAQTLEQRMVTSDAMKGRMPANLMYDNSGYSNIQRGYYDINGTTIFFRSKWEANYALYLDFLIDQKQIYKWEFEPDTFMFEAIKLGTRSYTPDFKVFNNENDFEYHEVKGYMDSRSKTKLKRFAKYYPEHTLVLIDGPIYNVLKKQIGKLCNFY